MKHKFEMKYMPEIREQIAYGQKMGMSNRLRIFRGYAKTITNLIKLERYEEAELNAARLTGILRAWDMRRERELNACLKSAAAESIK
jgi:capsid protein